MSGRRHARLRVLYAGPTWKGSTCVQRREALELLGYEVAALDTTPYMVRGGRIRQAWRYRAECCDEAIRDLNRAFVRLVDSARPDIAFLDNVPFLNRASLLTARTYGRPVLVHRNNDDPFARAALRWRIFKRAIPYYDLHFVARDANLVEYARLGAPCVRRIFPSFDAALHRPLLIDAPTRHALGGPVGFVGAWEEERARSIRHLGKNGVPVRVWGPNWRASHGGPGVVIEGRSVVAGDYVRAICAFDICLGFLRKMNRDSSTSRSVEIPACGTFMLAERSDEHRALFVEGEEAEFFASDAELLAKTRHYLAHPEERRRVAACGRARCLRAGYDNVSRMKAMLREAVAAASRIGRSLDVGDGGA